LVASVGVGLTLGCGESTSPSEVATDWDGGRVAPAPEPTLPVSVADSGSGGTSDAGTNSVLQDAGTGGTGGRPGTPGDAAAGTDAGAGDGGPLDVAPPRVSNLTIEPNPNNVLSCYVSFETDEPVSAEVQFGVGEPEFRIRPDDPATLHRMLVIGMHPDTDYLIRVVASNDGGSTSVDGAFETGSLPDVVPVPELTVSQPGWLEGWTLTNMEIDAGSNGASAQLPAVFIMVDEEGLPVWYYIDGTTPDVRGDIAVEVQPDDSVIVGPAPGESAKRIDLGGNVLWQGPPQSVSADVAIFSHETKWLDDGSYVLLRDSGGTSVEQYDAMNNLISSWTLLDHFGPTNSGDWCHGNSVTVDLDADIMYVNCRWEGTFKVQRSTGEILWFLSGSVNASTAGDFTFQPSEGRFSDVHDPEFHDDGTVLMYDNRYGTDHSRVVEYDLDQENLVATLVWEFPGNFDVDPWYRDDWYSLIWGDADRLANGDVLVNAGIRTGDNSRVFEVTRAGEVVWELRLREGVGTYRAQRLSPPPLVERLPVTP
jgi:hypothetical protein